MSPSPIEVPLAPADRISFSEAGKLLGVSAQTVWRWSLKPNKYGVRLSSFLLGGVRYTTPDACRAYIADTTAVADEKITQNDRSLVGSTPLMRPTPSQRRAARIAKAKRELAKR